MRISRGQLIAAAALLAGGVWLHNRNQTLKQQFHTIAGTVRTNGKEGGSRDFICSSQPDNNSSVTTLRTDGTNYIHYQRGNDPIRHQTIVHVARQNNPVLRFVFPIQTSVISNGRSLGSGEPSKLFSLMENAVGKLCPNTPNPSPNNNTSPAHSSGSVALGFFRPQGNTIG
jgi:hypothetical protein